jgi:hypothetical protein
VVNTDEDAYDEACPDCGAEPGARCTYLPLKNIDMDFLHYRSPKIQARAALTGTPTKRPHNGRLNAAWRRRDLRLARERRKARERPIIPAGRDAREAALAMVEFDRREYLQLVIWFKHHGGIFQAPVTVGSTNDTTPTPKEAQ